MHFRLLNQILLYICFLVLTACQNTSVPNVDAVKNQLDVPASWQSPSSERTPSVDYPSDEWWLVFRDKQLDRLVDAVLNQNQNLAAAVFRLREMELNRQFVGTNRAPDATAGLNGSSSKQFNRGTPSNRSYGSSFSLNYEVDLWGKIAASRDVAAWEASATALDLEAARLELIGSALELYWRHAWYTERLRLLGDDRKRLDYLLKLAQLRYRVGSGARLEALQAQQELENHENDRQALLNQRKENLRSISALLAQPPGKEFPFRLPEVLTDDITMVQAPLPVVLLARRPDLRAAEYRLRNRLANIEITRKSFYPTLALSASVNAGANPHLANILSNPVGSLGGSLMLPFIQYREMALKTGMSEWQYKQAVAEFIQTFYNILKEVENVLSQRAYYYHESLRLKRAGQTAEKTWKASEAAWKAGRLSLKDVLDQQQTLLNVKQLQIENRLNRHLSEMRLFLATGGW